MNTPTRAILWELWRTSRSELLLVAIAQMSFVLLLGSVRALDANFDDSSVGPVLCGIFVLVAGVSSCFSQSWRHSFESSQAGYSFRIGFTRPVSTWMLVLVPMIYIATMGPICYLIPAVFFRLLLGYSVPLLFPALLSACTVCGLTAAAWIATTFWGKVCNLILFGLLLIGGLTLFHYTRHSDDVLLIAIGKPSYFMLAWYEYVAMFSLPILATALTVSGVERQRHGEHWWLENVVTRWASSFRNRPVILATTNQEHFRSPLSAQCWYELRRFGVRTLVFAAVAPLLPLCVLVGSSIWNATADHEPQFWLAAIVSFPLAYQLIGADGALGIRAKQGAVSLPAFDATRPFRNDQLIAIKIILISACTWLGWLWLWFVALAQGWLSGDWPLWVALVRQAAAAAELLPADLPVYWWLSMLVSCAFVVVSSTAMMLAGGLWSAIHPRWLVALIFILGAHYVAAIWDAAHGWTFRYVWMGYAYILSTAIAGLCIWALCRSLTSNFLSRRYFYIALAAWICYVASTLIALQPLLPIIPFYGLALLGAGLLISLAATAFAPLALAANRHA